MSWRRQTIINSTIAQWERRKDSWIFPLNELTDYTFHSKDLSKTIFGHTDLKRVCFIDCKLSYCSFLQMKLINCTFKTSKLFQTNFTHSDLQDSLFIESALEESLTNKYTGLPSEYSWMHSLRLPNLDYETQLQVWLNYPKKSSEEEQEDYITLAILEYGENL